MIDSPALVYLGAAAAARLNETAELAQKGAGRKKREREAKFGRLGGSEWTGHGSPGRSSGPTLERGSPGGAGSSAQIGAAHQDLGREVIDVFSVLR